MKEASVSELNNRIKGTIVKLHEKGWGFIVSHKLPFTRIYFYWTALEQGQPNFKELHKGMEVEFEPHEHIDRRTKTNKGYRAYKIMVL